MILDCQDLNCPEPVLQTKKALDSLPEDAILEVMVNSVASKENVVRFAKNGGFDVQLDENGDAAKVIITKGYGCAIKEEKDDGFLDKTLFLKDDKVGEGELGSMLAVGFLAQVLEQDKLPRRIILVNRAVLLACADEGSDSVNVLKGLVAKGIELYSCGICLQQLGVEDQLKVGVVGNAYSTVEMLLNSEGTITL